MTQVILTQRSVYDVILFCVQAHVSRVQSGNHGKSPVNLMFNLLLRFRGSETWDQSRTKHPNDLDYSLMILTRQNIHQTGTTDTCMYNKSFNVCEIKKLQL